MAIEKSKMALRLVLSAVLILQSAGCGTIMYPERRGQLGGRLDPGVAILDGIGLLFFILPGVVAFAVDFSDGAIYLPSRPRPMYGPYPPPPPPPMRQSSIRSIRFDPKRDAIAEVERILRQETGRDIRLNDPALEVSRLSSTQELPALLNSGSGLARAPARSTRPGDL